VWVSRPHDAVYDVLKRGGIAGAPGNDGTPGDLGDPAEPALDGSFASGTSETVPEGLSVPATASFLQMLYDRFRARYMVTDPLHAKRFDTVKGMSAWLVRIKNLVSAGNAANSPLLKALDALILSSEVNLNRGRDYFGKDPLWVPLLSLGTYTSSLDKALDTFQFLEEKANEYFESLTKGQQEVKRQKLEKVNAEKFISKLKERKTNAYEKIDGELKEIATIEKKRTADREALKAALEKFKAEITLAFGLTWDTFFNCLSQLAFTDDKSNIKGGLMVVSQVGVLTHEAAANVLTDAGERVQKAYMFKEIKSVKPDNLKEQLTAMQGGFLSDESSYSVLVNYAKFCALVENFRKSVRAAPDLIEKLETYIDKLRRRNRHVDDYNELLQLAYDIQAEIDKSTHQNKVIQGKLSEAADPGLPELTACVAGLLEGAKSNCLTVLNLACRAYAFWGLERFNGLAEIIGGENARNISCADLRKARGDLDALMLERLAEHATGPNPFGPSSSDDDSMGKLVVLTPETHPDIFSGLKNNLRADFEIEPATRASYTPEHDFEPTTAAWSLSNDQPKSPSRTNPFHGRCDVRLTRARPWMVGMSTTTGKHDVYLFHLGPERFITDKDGAFPGEDSEESRYFTHEEIPIHFVYEPGGLKYDPTMKKLTTGAIHKHTIGAEDANIGLADAARGGLPPNVQYAPIGPFGRWRIRVRPEDNSAVSGLQLIRWGEVWGMPASGRNLVIAGTDSDGLLHIRTFDVDGVRIDTFETRDSKKELHVVTAGPPGEVRSDTLESSLHATQAGAITTLKQKLEVLFGDWCRLDGKDDRADKQAILTMVSGCTGLAPEAVSGSSLELWRWGDGSGVRTSGRNLIIAGTDGDGLLHIRTFNASGGRMDTFEQRDKDSQKRLRLAQTDGSGKLFWEKLEANMPDTTRNAISTLKHAIPNAFRSWLDLIDDERRQVFTAVESITGLILEANVGVKCLRSWSDGSGAANSGHNHVILGTDSDGLLHIRTFDAAGVQTDTFERMDNGDALHLLTAGVLSDTLESDLPTTQADAITTLKQKIVGLLPRHDLSGDERKEVLTQVASITGFTPTDNAGMSGLKLMPWGDGSGVPTSGQKLVIAGTDNSGVLHIRVFDAAGVRTDTYEAMKGGTLHLMSADASGKVLSDSPESSLPPTQADAITTLKKQLKGWLPRHDLHGDDKDEVLAKVASITGLTHLGLSLEKLEMIVIDFHGFSRTNVES
jgi:uncharacterized protein YodC (DUF2158 family)